MFTRVVGWAVLLCVFAPGVLLSAMMPYVYLPTFEKPNEEAASIFPHVKERDPDYLFVLNTPGIVHTFYLHPIVECHSRPGLDVRVR